MDELVKMVAQKVGIPEDKARSAVDIVINQLKTKLPDPLAGQIDNALSGSGRSGGAGLGGGLGGMLNS